MPFPLKSRHAVRFALHLKRLSFILIPLLVLLGVCTLALHFLEKSGFIKTERADDLVANPPVGLIEEFDRNGELFLRIQGPRMITSEVRAKKPSGTVRIIITGESFAMGAPYVHQFSECGRMGVGDPAHWIGAELSMRFPSLTFEVVNAGAGAQNSSRVLPIMKELCRIASDVMVVATGNNEGYISKSKLSPALHRWVFFRVMKKTLLSEPRTADRPYFTAQDRDERKIALRYRRNISGMIDAAAESGRPLVLATLPINYKYQSGDPEMHGKPMEAATDPELEKGKKLQAMGDYEGALEHYARCPNRALALKSIAECLEGLGRYEDAKEFYRFHVEKNPMNRIRPSFNEFLREISRSKKVVLADLERTLEDQSPHGIPSTLLFHDYCHMTWVGYAMMSEEIVRVLCENKLVTGAKGEPLPKPTIDEMIKKYGWERLFQAKWPDAWKDWSCEGGEWKRLN